MTATFDRSRRIESASAHMAGLSILAIAAASGAGLAVELLYRDEQWPGLAVSTAVLAVVGWTLWRGSRLPVNANAATVALRAVGVSWVAISVASALPFVVTGVLRWDLALFEGVSGLTGTGSTVLAPIEGNGHGLLFYRQLTQWVGGMGVVVLAVAVLPFLGIGGLSLFRAESPGPTSDQLTNRVTDTAKRLWKIYCVLTALSIAAFLATGLTLYDAASHAATALGTGGFSPYNDSISHFDSAAVEAAAQFGMLLGATKFTLFYAAYRGRDLRVFWRDAEFRFFVGMMSLAVLAVTWLNAADGSNVVSAFRGASFNVVSLVSTTGFGTDDFTTWVGASQLILLFAMVSGSMTGSTSAAIKTFRVQVVIKHAWREVRRVRHPSAVFPVRLGSDPVPESVVQSVLGYVLIYFVLAVASIVTLSLLGADLATSSGSVVTAMGGVGPGLGLTGPASNFLVVDGASRAVLIVLMLAGRLEIFPLLVLVPTARVARLARSGPIRRWAARQVADLRRSRPREG